VFLTTSCDPGFARRDQVAHAVGSFTFTTPQHATARLRATHGIYWEFDFIDAHALATVGEAAVAVSFRNHGSRPVTVEWHEADQGLDVRQPSFSIAPGTERSYWSGMYSSYHNTRTQLTFSEPGEEYDIEVILDFDRPLSGVVIRPYVNTPVI
jgi:hypothetical protein